MAWCVAQMNYSSYKPIKAHPSANFFPGKVAPGAMFISKVVHISHHQISNQLIPVVAKLDYSSPWSKNLYSTGLYAQAGQYIEVTVPDILIGKKGVVQIGIHADNLGKWVAVTEARRRMPLVVKITKVTTKVLLINSAFGGLVYLAADPKSALWEADIKISRAIHRPYLKL